jgi:4-hydroxy-4-methyl-2-oxoglutarate aldolase
LTHRLGPEQLDALAALGTATIGEVAGSEVRILDAGIQPLAAPAVRTAGHALTVQCRPGDNLAIHLALAQVTATEILIVDYGGSTSSGPFGEIMALAAKTRGARGLVIDGTVRDRFEIVTMDFPVFCRGTAIPGTTKQDRGQIGVGCAVGGISITQGDLVVADADAIVVFDAGNAEDILAEGAARLRREADIMERIRNGETTCEIFGLH